MYKLLRICIYHLAVNSYIMFLSQTAPPRGASGKVAIVSPHGALRAYTVFLTGITVRDSVYE